MLTKFLKLKEMTRLVPRQRDIRCESCEVEKEKVVCLLCKKKL